MEFRVVFSLSFLNLQLTMPRDQGSFQKQSQEMDEAGGRLDSHREDRDEPQIKSRTCSCAALPDSWLPADETLL